MLISVSAFCGSLKIGSAIGAGSDGLAKDCLISAISFCMCSTADCTFQRRTMPIIQSIRKTIVSRLMITKLMIRKVVSDSGISGSPEVPPSKLLSCD